MKKANNTRNIISLLIILCAIAFFCGCGNTDHDSTTPDTQPSTISTGVPANSDSTNSTDSTASGFIETDENLITVKITLPAYMFEDEDTGSFDAAAYAKEQDLLSATVNEDGSVTVVMTKARHRKLLEETAAQLDADFEAHVSETPYIKEISRNENFSQITVKVIRADYESAFDFTHLAVGLPAMIYQALIEMESHVEVRFVDVETGGEVYSCVFPDVLEQWG